MKKLISWFGALWHVLNNERGEVGLDTDKDKDKADELDLDDKDQDDKLEEKDELEEWQKEEAEDSKTSDQEYQVDGKLHQAMKNKLKGRVSDRDSTIDRLRKERDDARTQKLVEEKTTLVKPKQDDFDTDEKYAAAQEKYNDDRMTEVWDRKQLEKNQGDAQQKVVVARKEAVEGHYERAGVLIEKSGIKPEVYKAADATVRKAVESTSPKLGNIIVDQVISMLGEGSEKVMYFLGRNKAALSKFQSLLSDDPSGMTAAVYLGQEKQRLTNPTKPRSNAPDPASGIKGDESVGGGAANKLKKKYDAAHTKGNTQAAYNAKKEARAAGVDVKTW